MFQVTLNATREMMSGRSLRLGRFGALDDLEYSTRYGDGFGGHDLCSFELNTTDWNITGLALPGDKLTVDVGALLGTWVGRLTKVTPGTGKTMKFQARGYGYDLAAFLAMRYLEPGYEPTSDADTAIDHAVLRGLPTTLSGPLPTGTAYTADDPTSGLNNNAQLLTAALREQGLRWQVYGDVLAAVEDATEAQWRFRAGGQVLGVSGADYASSVWVRYADTDDSDALKIVVYPEPGSFVAPFGGREFPYDITNLGPMTAGRALALATAMYQQVKQKPVVTDSLSFEGDNGGGLESWGGGPALLPLVRGGELIRVTDFRSTLTQAMPEVFADMVIGQTTYRLSSSNGESLNVTSMDTSPTSFEEIMASWSEVGTRRPVEVAG